MQTISKEARGFVEGVVAHLRKGGKVKGAAPKVQSLLFKVTAQAKREREAVVTSSVKLTAAEQTAITKALSSVMGRKVEVSCRISADLLGGIKIQMADWVVDASLVGQLEQMALLLVSSV